MNYATRPPEKLSGLIELAIGDARKLDRDSYAPLHTRWHRPEEKTKGRACNVCLAGALIAGTLGAAPDRAVDVLEERAIVDTEWENALLAVNYARTGRWMLALAMVPLQAPVTPGQEAGARGIPTPACHDFRGWREFDIHLGSLKERIGQLRALGL